MNAISVPEILTDESLFAACAMEAANHIMRQPAYISRPVARYGACIAQNTSVQRETLVDFMRAMHQARAQTWTSQLNNPLYVDDLDRLENTIARNVYQVYHALNLVLEDPS